MPTTRPKWQELVPIPQKKKGWPRKKVQSDPNQASGSKFVRSKKKLGIKRGGDIAEDRVLADEHDGIDVHVEVVISQPKDNYEKGYGLQDEMDSILQSIIHANDDKGVEDVEPNLTKTLDGVGDAMDATLKGVRETDTPQTSPQPHLITFLFLILVPPLNLDLEDKVVIFPSETNSISCSSATNYGGRSDQMQMEMLANRFLKDKCHVSSS
ncbi:unnamed protein product [Lactuca saligna]|uniref:Uncharacterized protein n=1 Tax=Lactuca saligna TaxID=75948 RepID=A0AA36E729_LACSI|nr:unnamed protein product [Lactuca saligna]